MNRWSQVIARVEFNCKTAMQSPITSCI